MKKYKKKLAIILLAAAVLLPGSRLSAKASEAEEIVSASITESMAKGMKVYKAEIKFDSAVFEEPEISDMQPENGWGRLLYNRANHQFILTCENTNAKAGDILTIRMRRKSGSDSGNMEVRLTDITYSDGVQDMKAEDLRKDFSKPGESQEEQKGQPIEQQNQKTKVETASEKKGKTQKKGVRTGDETPVGTFVLLCVGSAAVILYVGKKKRGGILLLVVAAGCSLMMEGTVHAGMSREDDITALGKYLIQAGTLKEETEFDLNDDNKVSLTDLAMLLNINRYRYEETNEQILNPDIGFYNTRPIACKPDGTDRNQWIGNPASLVHFRVGLSAFSSAAGGTDSEITQDAIEALDSYMDRVRKAGGTAIIRLAYDNFQGKKDMEPDISLMVRHIEQLKPFFERNADVIACVETGMLGPWGEQHSSTAVTPDNIKAITEAYLKAVPENRTVNLRRPLWYCHVTGVDIGAIHQNITQPGTDAYRIGIYNDGYLGSVSDLGTFVDREKEINWLSNQALHTCYGGEAVSAGIQDKDENGFLYNSPEHMISEMFRTHTTYLNSEWNDSLLKKWKETPYQGEDTLYQGKTAYEYIENHLGYRFVLRYVDIPVKEEADGSITLTAAIQNVGAGNVVNEKEAVLILKNEGHMYEIEQSFDIRQLKSKETDKIKLEIPASLNPEKGNYEVYLKIQNKGAGNGNTKQCIQIASAGIWEKTLGANKLGEIQIGDEN